MKATTTRRGTAGGLPPRRKKKKAATAGARGFMCGCGGSKSVSTVAASISAVTTPLAASSNTTTASAAKTKAVPAAVAEGTPSVDALLVQLRELERGVRALGVREREADGGGRAQQQQASSPRVRPPPRHRRSASDWGEAAGRGRRLEEESVAVVTESADPRRDFRRSMAQMIVENEITGTAALRELLQRFLSLNSARHHHLILRAFADVWEELFAAAGHVDEHRHHHHRPAKSIDLSIVQQVSNSN